MLMVSARQNHLLAVRIEYTKTIYKNAVYDTSCIGLPTEKKDRVPQ